MYPPGGLLDVIPDGRHGSMTNRPRRPQPQRWISPETLCLALILCGATWLRIHNLTATGFWRDEGASLMMAEELGLGHLGGDNHPPLYYALLLAWSSLSTSDFWLRFLSVLLGVLTTLVVYAIGRELFGIRAGLWSATALSILPIHIEHSQEVRMYALMALLFAGAIWGITRIGSQGSFAGWCVYTVSSALLCYSHAAGVLYWLVLASLLALTLYSSGRLTKSTLTAFAVTNLSVVLALVPWLGVLSAKTAGVVESFWISRPDLRDLFIIPFARFTGIALLPPLDQTLSGPFGLSPSLVPRNRILFVPMILLSGVALLGLRSRPRWPLATVSLALALPILVLYLLSITVKPVLIPRAVLPAAVALVLFWGAGLAVRGSWRHVAIVAALVVLAELSLTTFYFHRHQGRDPVRQEGWREASLYLQKKVETGDLVIVWPLRGLYLLGRYDRSGKLSSDRLHDARKYLTSDYSEVTAGLEAALGDLPRSRAVWVVDFATWKLAPVRDTVGRALDELGSRDFTGVYVTEFGRLAARK